VEIFHYKNNPSKCICTNIEKIEDFQYYMHIIWNEPFESDNLGKGRMTFWHMVKRVHGAKRLRTTALAYITASQHVALP
jgi:hypothetical protein